LACCCASSSTLPTCRTRDGAEAVLHKARRQFPFIERLIADASYQGPKMTATVARIGSWTLEIVRRCDRHRFVVLPKRWIVERTLAWISRCRRLARIRASRTQGCRLHPPGHDQAHTQASRRKPLTLRPNFPDGL
jgi:transposase